MAVAVTPSIPTESSTAAPAGGFSSWFKNIGDWIKSTSPTGATQYDTDWQTTGLTITPGTDWTVTGYRIRRVGKVAWIYLRATYGGADVATTSDGNLPDMLVATIPTEFSPTGVWHPVFAHEAYTRLWAGYVAPDGSLMLTHGALPSYTTIAGRTFTFQGGYPVD